MSKINGDKSQREIYSLKKKIGYIDKDYILSEKKKSGLISKNKIYFQNKVKDESKNKNLYFSLPKKNQLLIGDLAMAGVGKKFGKLCLTIPTKKTKKEYKKEKELKELNNYIKFK